MFCYQWKFLAIVSLNLMGFSTVHIAILHVQIKKILVVSVV